MVQPAGRGHRSTLRADLGYAHSTNGAHTLTARARDAAGNSTVSAPVTVNVANASFFQNEILATGFELPTSIEFLPNGDMLVVELHGSIWLLKPPYLTPEPTPFLHLTNVGNGGVQQGIVDIALDPNFATNHYVYVFYTQNSPNRDRLSRFTVNADLTAANPASELVIYQDPGTRTTSTMAGPSISATTERSTLRLVTHSIQLTRKI